jgi:hypothetical protein
LRKEDEKTLPTAYKVYKKQITHGAFLLGYGYSEAFLADLLRYIYFYNPHMLPDDKQLRFNEIRSVNSYKAVVKMMVEKEVYSIFAQSIEDVSDYFRKKLNMEWPDQEKEKAIMASLIRNCIIHNSAIVDHRLAKKSNNLFCEGDKIALSPTDVHSYGIAIRTLGHSLWDRVNHAFLKKRRQRKSANK